MSADNGYILRKNEAGKFVLQMYFASADDYPPIDDRRAQVFDTLDDAIVEYERIEDHAAEHGIPIEYGLTVSIKKPTKAKSTTG